MPGETINFYNFQQNISIFMILVLTVGFSCMLEIVVRPEKTFDIALLIISNMAAISLRSNDKLIPHSTE